MRAGGAADAPGGGAHPRVPAASLPSQGRCVLTLGWTSGCAVALQLQAGVQGQSSLGATPGLPPTGHAARAPGQHVRWPRQADGQGQHRAALPRRGARLRDAVSLPGPLVSHERQSPLQKCAGWGRRRPLPRAAPRPVHPEPTGVGVAAGERSTGQELSRETSALASSLRPRGGLRRTPSPSPLRSVSLPRAAGASSVFQMLTARRVLH